VSLFVLPLINTSYVSIQTFDQFTIIVLVAFDKLLISSKIGYYNLWRDHMTIGQIASINFFFYFVHMSISKNVRKGFKNAQ